jgi:hypothetical protein
MLMLQRALEMRQGGVGFSHIGFRLPASDFAAFFCLWILACKYSFWASTGTTIPGSSGGAYLGK